MIVTLSGIFRDLLPLQTRLLAEAACSPPSADEPVEQNFVRKPCAGLCRAAWRATSRPPRCASSRNAEGAYGANVNLLIDNRRLDDEDELADAFERARALPTAAPAAARQSRAAAAARSQDVDLAYQNLESVELGVTTVDHYFDTLGGISRAVQPRQGGRTAPVYIGDQTRGEGKVRTLARAGRAGDPHARAQPEMVRGRCSSMATRACARSRRR